MLHSTFIISTSHKFLEIHRLLMLKFSKEHFLLQKFLTNLARFNVTEFLSLRQKLFQQY